MSNKATLDIHGRKVDVTNLDKVFYPKTGFTKGNIIDYYVRISPVLLPHLKDRAINLKRYPDGVEGFFFYEKNAPAHRPKWIKTTKVPKDSGGEINYCVMNDLPALVWAANLADLEMHTFLHKAPALQRPTTLAFDLDPGAPADILECGQIGLWLKSIFDSLGMASFPKTSGSKGLQVYIPLNTATNYDKTKAFALEMALVLESKYPEKVVSRMQKTLRSGKVLVDWSQNDDKKTTVNAYSLRAKEHPTVSTPVTWEEVATAVLKKNAHLLTFESEQVFQRVAKSGDLFSDVLTLKQKLPPVSAIKTAAKAL